MCSVQAIARQEKGRQRGASRPCHVQRPGPHVLARLRTSWDPPVAYVQEDLEAARRHEEPTLFDIIVGIISEHGPGGREAEYNVHLVLG